MILYGPFLFLPDQKNHHSLILQAAQSLQTPPCFQVHLLQSTGHMQQQSKLNLAEGHGTNLLHKNTYLV